MAETTAVGAGVCRGIDGVSIAITAVAAVGGLVDRAGSRPASTVFVGPTLVLATAAATPVGGGVGPGIALGCSTASWASVVGVHRQERLGITATP